MSIETQQHRTLSKHLSRRDLLRAGLWGSAGWAVWSMAPQRSIIPVGPTLASAGEQPRAGGTLLMWTQGDPPNFDLHQNSAFVVNWPMSPCYNQLVRFDPLDQSKIIPDLAERWEMAPDGKSYTFSLHKGVKFHDGKPLTSLDVKTSLDRIRQPPEGVVSPRAEAFSAVEAIESPDDFTVTIRLSRPNPSLMANLAQGWMAIYPKHVLDKEGDMKKVVVGTGPFKLKRYTRGVSIELEKNPDYFVQGRPYLDGITLYIVPDFGTAYAAFRTRRLLLMSLTLESTAHQAESDLGNRVVIHKVPQLSMRPTVNLNTKRKPWDDIRVREAVSLAIDRQAAIRMITDNEGVIGGFMPPGGPWALPSEEIQKIPGFGPNKTADIERAKQLLAEAGHGGGIKTTLLTRMGAQYERISVFLKGELAKIGIDANLDVKETAAAYEVLNSRSFDVAPWATGAALDDPDAIFGEHYTCDAVRNYAQLCIPEVDALYQQQSQTLDVEERKRLVHEMERKALLGFGRIMTHWRMQFVGHWPEVRNYSPHISIYNNQRFQDVWLARA
jgi:peptide/nickel transport system substrate-binding protein